MSTSQEQILSETVNTTPLNTTAIIDSLPPKVESEQQPAETAPSTVTETNDSNAQQNKNEESSKSSEVESKPEVEAPTADTKTVATEDKAETAEASDNQDSDESKPTSECESASSPATPAETEESKTATPNDNSDAELKANESPDNIKSTPLLTEINSADKKEEMPEKRKLEDSLVEEPKKVKVEE